MKKIFQQSSLILLITMGLMIFTFSGCNSDFSNKNSSLEGIESEVTNEQNSNKTGNNDVQERTKEFLAMANHDNYITGEIIKFDFQPYPAQSYLMVECKDKVYRVSGSLGQEGEGLQPFLLSSSYSAKDSQEIKDGWYATVFYDDVLSSDQTDITSPKEIFLSMYATPSEVYDVAQQAEITQYLAEILVKNFYAIENKKIFTPDEAMLYVADYLQLENLQKKELSRGKYHY
ncbi:MAG: hypothetical protein RSA20_10450, partial [Oscillospiraceae bacterium]